MQLLVRSFLIKLLAKRQLKKYSTKKDSTDIEIYSEIKQTKLEQINNDQSIPSTLIEEVSSLKNIHTYIFIIETG